jgi:VWFA-related protein
MSALRLTGLAALNALVCLLACAQTLSAQIPDQSKRGDQSEVLRVYTELVQTDVMVFDKSGKFVPGLTRDDFELKIDGKPRPIEFFEKIIAGSPNEESQLAAARGSSARITTNKSSPSAPLDRGRAVFFYIDDLHLDQGGMKATRDLITQFIEKEMGQNDEAAVASASGQIGFLQQLTNDKAVLRSALKRLNVRPYSVRDFESPPMTEYQAVLIENLDHDVFDYFVEETLRRNPGISRDIAEGMVHSRSRSIVSQAGYVTTNMLAGLEGLVRSARELPGRKLVFFISGGFFLSERTSDAMDRLRRITSAAARSSVVIYSMDARGLVASLRDASSESQFDPSGRLGRADSGELSASQDGLNALAKDTGGKIVINTNSLGPGLKRALTETSVYYLLAWKPDPETPAESRFRRIEVKVKEKPELVVQVRRGFYDVDPAPPIAKASKEKKPNSDSSEKEPVGELRKVMYAAYPNRELPVSLRLSYINTPDRGNMLTAFMEVPGDFLTFGPTNGKRTAVVDVVGTVLNDKGKAGAAFSNQVTIEAPASDTGSARQNVGYGHNVYVEPGLYQVRVGARDEKGSRSGSAHAWIEIPNIASGQLAMSSVLVGVRASVNVPNSSPNSLNPLTATELRLAHHFSQGDFLRFMVFVYNAARAPADAKPDIALQIQILRDDQPVVTTPLRKIAVEGVEDLARLPYAAELPLTGLPSGRYVLQITAIDRLSKQSSSQQTRFDIE